MNPYHCFRRKGLIIAVAVILAGFGSVSSAQSAPRSAAPWQSIFYPPLEIPTAKGETCRVLVGSGAEDAPRNLRFDVIWSGQDSVPPPDAIMKADRMSVRLHLPDGAIAEPSYKDEGSPEQLNGAGGTQRNRMYRFPWGQNKLEEAWFEFRIDHRTYWIEVPYGFSRDPMAALAPGEPKAGPPALAPAMKTLPELDFGAPCKAGRFLLGESPSVVK